MNVWCPYPECGFGGTEDEVDEHRTTTHTLANSGHLPEQGSNLRHRPVNSSKPMCPRHGGEWGDDETCEHCTDERGQARPTLDSAV